jgi:hypothetical protein
VAASLKISANTSEVKKSLLDLGRDVKSLGKTKISIFSDSDKKFIKGELKSELALMKTKLMENRGEISKLVKEQNKMEKGTKAELDARKKILAAYKEQTKLANQMDRVQKSQKELAGGAGSNGGMMSKIGGMLGGAALLVGGMALARGYQAQNQYKQGVNSRVRLRGLTGSGSDNGSPEELANAGLTEQQYIQRRINATALLGRAGGSKESIMGQAKFERAYGLEEGSMQNVSGSLRSTMGGAKADEAQMKIQASILASGIEDAIAPYLESMTGLLDDINKNGITNTDELMNTFAELARDGKRTPEQLASAFGGIDSAVKGSSGDANAFLQTAFARGGIGGGTVGSTRLAMESGGIFGLDEKELANKGYNPALIANMKSSGFMSGMGKRTGSILDQFKQSAGIGGQNIGDVKDMNTMQGLASMSNGVFGTKGMQGFDALQMMEKVQNKQMTQKQFDDKLSEMKAGNDPSVQRLDKINGSLEGQTGVLRDINTNLMENLGKKTVKVANTVTEADNALIQGTDNVAGTIDSSGVLDGATSMVKSLRSNLTGGGLGEKAYDMFHGGTPWGVPSSSGPANAGGGVSADALAAAMKAVNRDVTNNNTVKIRIQNSDGSVTDKTHK